MKNLKFSLLILALLLGACGTRGVSTGGLAIDTSSTVNICHATDDSSAPYALLSLGLGELPEHTKHTDDLIPAPAEGCPNEVIPNANNGKIAICHATGDSAKPYNKITISLNGLNGHSNHPFDFILDPQSADCPSGTLTPSPTPSPTFTPDPFATATLTPTIAPTDDDGSGGNDKKITICHAAGGKKKIKYVQITISINGLNGHEKHPNDIIPAPAGGCPK